MTQKPLMARANEFPGNGFFGFLQAMQQASFREANGKGLAIIEPGRFDELVITGRNLGHNFTKAEVIEVIGQLDEKTIKEKGLSDKSVKFLCAWIKNCR